MNTMTFGNITTPAATVQIGQFIRDYIKSLRSLPAFASRPAEQPSAAERSRQVLVANLSAMR